MSDVGKAALFRVLFQHTLLVDDGVTLSRKFVVAGKPLIKSGDFVRMPDVHYRLQAYGSFVAL